MLSGWVKYHNIWHCQMHYVHNAELHKSLSPLSYFMAEKAESYLSNFLSPQKNRSKGAQMEKVFSANT